MSTRHTNKRKGRYFLCLSDGKERQKGPLLQALVYTSRPLQSAGRLSDSKGQWILLEQGMHCCSRTLETALPLFALHPFYARVAGGCFHMRVLSSTRQQRRKWGAGRAPHTPPPLPPDRRSGDDNHFSKNEKKRVAIGAQNNRRFFCSMGRAKERPRAGAHEVAPAAPREHVQRHHRLLHV